MAIKVQRDSSKFYVELEGKRAKINFKLPQEDVIELVHTEVPDEFRGKGVAEEMAKVALQYARDNHLKVIPSCRFVNAYIQRHKEYQDLVYRHEE